MTLFSLLRALLLALAIFFSLVDAFSLQSNKDTDLRTIDCGEDCVVVAAAASETQQQLERRDFIKASILGVMSALGIPNLKDEAVAASAITTTVYNTANDIPASVIENHEILYGYVERVIDGDTIRARHIPDLQAFLKSTKEEDIKKKKPPLSNTTIVIRMYGVDAPETAKSKSETSQPFGEDAKQLTKDLTYHKIVSIKLLSRDKYNRIVAEVDPCAGTSPSSSSLLLMCGSTDISQELAARGLATMYTGRGAEYDGKLDLLKRNIENAQRSKIGIWSLGDDMVTPAEYKRMKKAALEGT